MRKFDTVLFDLDGTLTDPYLGVSSAVCYSLDKMGVERPPQATLKKFIGPPLVKSYAEYCGLNEIDTARAIELYREYYSVTGKFENRVYDGVPQMLAALKNRGLKLYVATSKPEPFACDIIKKFGLIEHLDGVFGASLDSSRIEKEQVVKYALDSVGADRARTVMIGDRMFDVHGAKVNGLKSVGVLYGYGDRAELVAAGADYIANTPEEVVTLLLNYKA